MGLHAHRRGHRRQRSGGAVARRGAGAWARQSKPSRPREEGLRLVARNKRAAHDYEITHRYEAGVVLVGTEVKALREGRASLAESWVEVDDRGEAWLHGAHIPEYSQGSWTNHSARRPRKLLLHAAQLERLAASSRESGWTVVPTSLYFLGSWVKVEVGIARGKQEHDKRQALRERQDAREAERAMAVHRRSNPRTAPRGAGRGAA